MYDTFSFNAQNSGAVSVINMRLSRPLLTILLSLLIVVPAASAEVVLEVLNPLASMEVPRVVPVPRLTSFDNKRILLYWNKKLYSDVAVTEIRDRLSRLYPKAVYKIVEGTAWQPEPGFYETIMEWKPDAVIASTAD